MTLTYGSLLTESFGWPQGSVGLINVSNLHLPRTRSHRDSRLTTQAGIFPAALLSMLWAGWLSDKMNIWLAKRAGCVHIPEHSLIMLVLPTLVSVVGIVVYATTAYRPANHSAWGLIMGWFSTDEREWNHDTNSCSRLDIVRVWIRGDAHHIDAFCSGSVSEQPRPSFGDGCWHEECSLFW